MSLINQVLQDLQERRAPDFNTAAATLRDVAVPVAKPAVRRTLPPVLLWIMIVLLAGISATLLWQHHPAQRVAANPMGHRHRHAAEGAPLSPPLRTARAKPVASGAGATPSPLAKPIMPAAATAVAVTPLTSARPAPPISGAPAPSAASAKTTLMSAAAAPIPSQAVQTITAPTVTPPASADTPASRLKSSPSAALPSAASPMEKTLRPMSPEQQAELAYREGMRLLQSGRPSIATPRLQAALSALPTYYPARAALAALLINSNKLVAAHTLLSAGLELAPQQATLAKLDGRVLIEQGQLPQARVVLEHAAPPVSSDPEYYSLLGALYQRMGLYAQAAQSYRSIVEADPRNGVWWLGLGMALEAGGDTGAARAAYGHAQQTGTLNRAVLQFVQAKLVALP